MLGKLLKKDFYATCRFFVPLLCGYGVAAAVGKILFEIILSQSRQSFDSGWFNGIVVFSVFYMIIFAQSKAEVNSSLDRKSNASFCGPRLRYQSQAA